MQFLGERTRMLPPRDQSLLGGLPAYAPPDIEERIDAGDGPERDRRYLVGRFALAHVAGDIGQFEELAPRMAPGIQIGPIIAPIQVIDFSHLFTGISVFSSRGSCRR